MLKTKGLNAFQLKIIAIIAMTIDHVSATFYPEDIALRIIGRVTMPIMAYFIAEGYYYTKDVKKYFLRLLLASAVSVLPFGLLFGFSTSGNVMLTLALGLVVIWAIEEVENPLLKAVLVFGSYMLSAFGDWSYIGVLMVQLFWYAHKRNKQWSVGLTILFGFLMLTGFMLPVTLSTQILYGLASGGACLLAWPLLAMYNGEQGLKAKWLFYVYYPLHLTIILLIQRLLI